MEQPKHFRKPSIRKIQQMKNGIKATVMNIKIHMSSYSKLYLEMDQAQVFEI